MRLTKATSGNYMADARRRDGSRVRLSLRTKDERISRALFARLSDIVESDCAGVDPTPETRQWVRDRAPRWLLDEISSRFDIPLSFSPAGEAGHDGSVGDISPLRVRDLSQYLDHLRSMNRSEKYVSQVANVIEKFSEHLSGGPITVDSIHSFVKSERDRGISLPTVHLDLGNLRRTFDFFVGRGVIDINPVNQSGITVKVRDRDRRQRAPFTETELALLDRHAGTGLRIAIRLGATMGLRTQEVLQCKADWFDFENMECSIPASHSKSGRTDVVPISGSVAELGSVECGLNRVQLLEQLYALMEELSIPRSVPTGVRTFHSFRHTYGTMLARRGVHVENARKLMRHANVRTTLQFYTHLSSEDLRRAQSAISLPSAGRDKAEERGGSVLLNPD